MASTCFFMNEIWLLLALGSFINDIMFDEGPYCGDVASAISVLVFESDVILVVFYSDSYDVPRRDGVVKLLVRADGKSLRMIVLGLI